jgi:hypothetical protein
MNDELTTDPTEDELSEWESLTDRQKEMAEHNAEIAMEFGMFKQDSGPDGAHYFDGSKNPFKATGVKCESCIFFNEDANQCILVEGQIDPEGLCKLWIIPESDILEDQPQEPVQKSLWSGSFDPRSFNK